MYKYTYYRYIRYWYIINVHEWTRHNVITKLYLPLRSPLFLCDKTDDDSHNKRSQSVNVTSRELEKGPNEPSAKDLPP